MADETTVKSLELANTVFSNLGSNQTFGLLIIAMVVALSGFALYLRSSKGQRDAALREEVNKQIAEAQKARVAEARAANEIAAQQASTTMHDGQGSELRDIYIRLDALNTAYMKQIETNMLLMQRIAKLEATMVGLTVHFSHISLCKPCELNNHETLKTIQELLVSAKN